MKQNTPEFKIAVANKYKHVKFTILDEVFSSTTTNTKHRFRRAAIVFDNKTLMDKVIFPLRDIYEDVLEMISVDLKLGFGVPVISMEELDHQARDWILMKLEEFTNGEHPWCSRLKENHENVVVIALSFGGIAGTRSDGTEETIDNATELALLPVVICQLIDYTTEEGKILEHDGWEVLSNGVLINPSDLKQFGRS